MATAGHPPPLVDPVDGAARYLELPSSVPLGAARHVLYDEQDFELTPGSALLLYTDGLVERAGESLGTGLERLRTTVQGGDGELERLGDFIVDELLPEGPSNDDAALLLVRALPLSDTLVAQFPAEVESIPVMRRLLGRWLDEAGATAAEIDDLSLACAEAAANAIEHAYGLAPGVVELRASASNAGVATVAVRDFGKWRPPRGTHRGRGLLLMEGLTDEVEVIHDDDGTTVELSRRIGAEAA